MNHQHAMADLETWGRVPGADLRSIGAVMFDPHSGDLGEEFYIAVDGGEAYGLHRDPDTVDWWGYQSVEAQSAFDNPVDLKEGLQRFSDWYVGQNLTMYADPVRYTRFWAHGPHFDEQILAAAFRAVGLPVPWNYRAPRDLRTILEAAGLDPKNDIPNFGTEHNALDDSKAQALGVIKAFNILLKQQVLGDIERGVIRDLIGNYTTETKELRERRDSLLEANNREVERRRAAEALLRENLATFREYEGNHRAKAQIDGLYQYERDHRIEKAERNAEIAGRIEGFLNGGNNA